VTRLFYAPRSCQAYDRTTNRPAGGFWPGITVQTVLREDEAVRWANGVEYGLRVG